MEKSQISAPARLLSIDVLRGLTILVMLFVNDVAGVTGAPAWMKHYYPYEADGMTFVDVVFPAFLFIVGMAIPFALGRRLEGGSILSTVGHVCLRTAGLLVIGVYMVNTYTIDIPSQWLKHLWIILMYIGLILAFSPIGRGWKVPWTRLGGVALLVVLALVYQGRDIDTAFQMRTYWWGIIGLIGWAYLVASLGWIAARRSPEGILGLVALLYCGFFADRMGAFSHLSAIKQWVDIGSMLCSHSAITLSGVLMGMMLHPSRDLGVAKRLSWSFWFGAGLIGAGALVYTMNELHPMFILNKNAATPAWCLICSGITVWCWIVVYLLVDVARVRFWTPIVRPAGENPLFAYILAPMIYSIIALVGLAIGFSPYAKLGETFAVGFFRSLVFAFSMTWLAGFLKGWGLNPRL